MNIITEILSVVIAALLMISIAEYVEIKYLKYSVDTYQQQMAFLKLDSEKQQANTKQAYETAKKQVQDIRDETQAILHTKVSKNCEDSIQWLIKQANSF